MKALVHTAPRTFDYTEVADPHPAPGEVLVRVRAVGICGSDVHGMTGNTGRRIPPIIMGHEFSGEVAAVGRDVDRKWIGRRVTADSTLSCGACDFCTSGLVNLCENRRVLGVSCEEYRRDGALAEFVVVPESGLYELPDGVSFDQGAMIEPLSVALHAVRLADPTPSDRVFVLGSGVIGLLIIQSALASGCRSIAATDLSERRREAARRSGASHVIDPGSAHDGQEFDVVFEAVGARSTVGDAIARTAKGGKVVLVGNLAPEVPFPLQTVVTRQISVLGSCASAGEYPDCIELIRSGSVDLSHLMTDTVGLGQAAAMFDELLADPDSHLKAIVTIGATDV